MRAKTRERLARNKGKVIGDEFKIRNPYDLAVKKALDNLLYALGDALEHRDYRNFRKRKVNTEFTFAIVSHLAHEYPDGNPFDEVVAAILSTLSQHPFELKNLRRR